MSVQYDIAEDIDCGFDSAVVCSVVILERDFCW